MEGFRLFASPWWVNLLLLIPLLAYLLWRRRGLELSAQQLLLASLFAAAFGFVEGAVVIYLRAAVGLLPGYEGTLADVARLSAGLYRQTQSVRQLPPSLLAVEVVREAATLLMLVSVAVLAAQRARERCALFLWCFAIWDLSYYGSLWATVRWPASLRDTDVLFLIPVPWLSQVWFPLVVSLLALLAVLLARRAAARGSLRDY
ncbi:MAG TPA: hypothetical protein VE825_00520 [Terriglobales bacterium]|jgi:hypothetical protein|nr:hypothetical protein [Terriglobales bacterium]